jgi:hypothetical protein
MDAGEDARERSLRRESDHHPGDAGRREQRRAERAKCVEMDQDDRARDDAHHESRDATDDDHLGPVGARGALGRGV